MPKASEVAIELRKLADGLDTLGDTNVTDPWISFYHTSSDAKDMFLALAKAFPRPFTKEYEEGDNGDLVLKYKTPAAFIKASIRRTNVCRVVEPAKPAVYECEPLLSAEDHAALGVE
jgi:hypothetical protein